ncbi:deuterosome assembly protein 1 isoform X3 [Mesocricetus auratus]|uniref:Deuterosome assembly protein 1 n=1 Tax=Mesocricetus auratus TaxID=10036 RepID=A0ABM2WSM6_MESAU|nr:deuterosome assembly protein 1 isoform X3 [Mesocricetus auratus]
MENQAHSTAGASPCEAELQELMEQIDIMVSNKKLDWERKMRALETRLDLRDQELANAQTCLDQKGQEVGLLRQKLDSLEKCNLVMTQNYEGQLQALKAQFSKLTNNFEKLRLHQMKQSQVHRKEAPSKEETPFELNSLNQKLEVLSRATHPQPTVSFSPTHEIRTILRLPVTKEFRTKSREWDKQEILYQTHLVSLDAQQKLLSEKCNQFQAMEAGLSEVKNELQSRDDLLRIIEMERLHLHRELLKMGECQSAQENRKRLDTSYSPSTKEAERKRKELFSMVSDQPNHEKELNKMRSQIYQEEDRCSEQERMRNEISDLTQELHQKEMTIATVMKKAALLERQLKIELEIKEKMLTKQEVSDMRYKAVRTENTHLKGMMGDLDPARYLNAGLADKEQSRYTSINKLEYENQRLRSDLAKLHVNGKAAWPNQSGYDEAGTCAYQSQLKMETSGDRVGQDCELNRTLAPPSPPLPFHAKEMTSPLTSDEDVFPLSPPDMSLPASLAAQHFLMEEERRAKELERLLNTHIDELQRHTEFTLNKYTKFKQSRHV